MLHIRRLRKKPRLLRSLTGCTLSQFTELAARLEPVWEAAERQRLARPKRKRAIGAGHPYALPETPDKLLLLLVGWRHALTHELLGCLFDLDQSNCTRLIHRLSPLIERAADPGLRTFLRDAGKQHRKIGTMEDFLKAVPELAEILGDATEQPRRRPKGKRGRKKFYSGKKRSHTLKAEVIATPRGKILFVSDSYPGRAHDKTIHEKEKLPWLIPKKTRQYYDRGYNGLAGDYPDHDIRLPHQRKHVTRKICAPLTRGQKQANALHAKRRIPIEHVFCRMKRFRILSVVWRSRDEWHNPTFRAIAALTNFHLSCPA